MNIFLLNLKIEPGEGPLFEDDYVAVVPWHYSDVFTSEKKAVAFGKKMLADRLKKIKAAFKQKSIDDLIESYLECFFYIFEFNPDDKRGRKDDWAGRKKWEYFVWWEYDYKGNLLDRTQWDINMGWQIMPGDLEDDNAGTKFKPGTFVVLDKANYLGADDDTIYVVCGVPGKRSENPAIWENFYRLDFIDRNSRFNHDHVHESKIRRYEGIVPEDHPLQIIRKHAIGELELSNEMWDDIDSGLVLFDYPKEQKSWRDIPELSAAIEGGK